MVCHDPHANGAYAVAVWAWSPSFLEAVSVGFLHVVPFSRFVPLRSIRPAAALNAANITNGGVGAAAGLPPAAGPLFAGGRGRVSAPARFARLIARARRRAHVSRRLPRGNFTPARIETASGCRFFPPPPIWLSGTGMSSP